MFVDHKLEPVTDAHYCNKASIADVNAVLKHYKFIESFSKRVTRSVKDRSYSYFTHSEYLAYYKAVKDIKKFSMNSNRAKKYNMQDLINSKFLRVPGKFFQYVLNFNNG